MTGSRFFDGPRETKSAKRATQRPKPERTVTNGNIWRPVVHYGLLIGIREIQRALLCETHPKSAAQFVTLWACLGYGHVFRRKSTCNVRFISNEWHSELLKKMRPLLTVQSCQQ